MGSLPKDEYFVIEALCASYGGTWKIGEDPPDAYMTLKNHDIAVEISILTQHVVSDTGKPISRLSQDSGVLDMCDEINEELKHLVPSGMYIFLTMSAPLKKLRKFKTKLTALITTIVRNKAPNEHTVEIYDNKVKISLISGNRPSGEKVVGAVANRNSNADILANAQYILHDRINEKVKKCSKVKHRPLWLALFNDYWLAEPDTYKIVMDNLSIKHPFEKICLVSGNNEVHTLYEP